MAFIIDGKNLHNRLKELGQIGRDENGILSRLESNEGEKQGRDKVVSWMKELDLEIAIDKIGNIFGIWNDEDNKNNEPIMIGSHIDSVIDAGIYDGCYGVLGGIEVVKTLKKKGYKPAEFLCFGGRKFEVKNIDDGVPTNAEPSDTEQTTD